MNKQRKVLITITYNEMGIIIDTKAEEVTYARDIDAPIKRGRWIMDEEEPGMFMCSVCFDPWSIDDEETIKGFNYCPHCGAKMEGE